MCIRDSGSIPSSSVYRKMAATRYADVRRWWNSDDTWWRGSDATWSNSEPAFGSGVDNPRAAMAQDAGDEYSKALLKARFPGTEEEDRKYEREEAAREAGSGVANPMAAATPAPPACRSDMPAGSGVVNPSTAAQRRYEMFMQYDALERHVKILLVAIRRCHFLSYFNQYDKCTFMQLGITWWREVRVCPALFDVSEQDPRGYTDLITCETLHAMLQVTPLTIADRVCFISKSADSPPDDATRVLAIVASSSYVGHVMIDGLLYHES